MRQHRKDPLLSASLLVNYILFLALACYTVAAVTRHYALGGDLRPAVASDVATVAVTPIAEAKAAEMTPEAVEAEIRAIAAVHGFPWTDYLVRLAVCESRLDPMAKNQHGNTPSGSTDRGLFQINNHWHPEVSDEVAYDLRLATEWTIYRINNGYQHEWVCSKYI